MITKKDIISKITDEEEKIVISKVYDKYLTAYKNYEITYTDFLNPIVLSKIYTMFQYDNEIEVKLDGGFKRAERNIVTFINKNLYEACYDIPLTACKISYNAKYSKSLKHKDFLGALIGLGIKREKLGDINLFEDYAIVIMYKDMFSYITNNLEYVGRTKVKVSELDLKDVDKFFENKPTKEKVLTVSSLRADSVVASAFNLSRNNAQSYIKNEKLFINWVVVNSVSKEVKLNDIITVRGLGRIKINELKGNSKKGKEIINIKIY